MIKAYYTNADGSPAALESIEDLEAAVVHPPDRIWIDCEAPTPEEISTLANLYHLDAEAIEDCGLGEQRPRTDEFDDYVFLLLYGVFGTERSIEFVPRKLGIFYANHFIITIHRQSLRTLDGLRIRCERRPGSVLARGLDHLLYTIIDAMVDHYVILSEALEEQLEKLEEQSLQLNVGRELLSDLSRLRHSLIELRRIAVAKREVLIPIAQGEFHYISESLENRFEHVLHHITTVIELIDGLRDLTNSVRDNYHTALANRANNIMKVLTVFATIMLPMSLVAGIYGMNVELWPSADNPYSFWIIMGFMGAIGVGLLWFIWRRHWI